MSVLKAIAKGMGTTLRKPQVWRSRTTTGVGAITAREGAWNQRRKR